MPKRMRARRRLFVGASGARGRACGANRGNQRAGEGRAVAQAVEDRQRTEDAAGETAEGAPRTAGRRRRKGAGGKGADGEGLAKVEKAGE